jgi:hypothetical protein
LCGASQTAPRLAARLAVAQGGGGGRRREPVHAEITCIVCALCRVLGASVPKTIYIAKNNHVNPFFPAEP